MAKRQSNRRWIREKTSTNIFGNTAEGQKLKDFRNWNELDFSELGVHQNPKDENELFFALDGIGYGDIIQSIFYAEKISKMTGKYCKIVYVTLPEIRGHQLHSSATKEVVLTYEDEKRIVQNVVDEYNISEKVRICVVKVPIKKHSILKFNFTPMIRPQRILAGNHFFGSPTLEPKRPSEDKGYIAVWTTEHNLTPVEERRDPIGWEGMNKYISQLERIYKIKRISYRDSGEKIFNTISGAKLCIGYQGIGNLISKTFHKPIIVFSKNEYIGRTVSGHWAIIVDEFTDYLLDIEKIVRMQNELIGTYKNFKEHVGFNKKHLEYLGTQNENIQRSL